MSEIVYALCGATSLICSILLLRGYLRARTRLLLWSSLCFVGLAADNVLLFVDLVLVPDVSLASWRNAAGLVGLCWMLYGFIWDAE